MTGSIYATQAAKRHACPSCGVTVLLPEGVPSAVCGSCRVQLHPADAGPSAPRGENGVPAGLPGSIAPCDAAHALRWSEGRLRGRLDRGEIAYVQAGPGRTRYVLTSELARLEAMGEHVDWDALAELQHAPRVA